MTGHRPFPGFLLALAGLTLLCASSVLLAQGLPPPPPPPPSADQAPPPEPGPLFTTRPPVPVVIVDRAPAPVRVLPPPLPREQRPLRRASSPYGRFYVGAGAGYLWPGGTLGEQFESGGIYALWTGWRRRWLGFELGYLGAQLTRKAGDAPVILANEPGATTFWDPYAGDAYFSQLTSDAKVFLSLFCKSSLYARLGLNYTALDYGSGFKKDGFGWQAGVGWDYRIRLSFAPDLVLKLRAEALYTWAKLKCVEGGDCHDFSGLATLFYVNLGWSPRRPR